MKQQKVEYFELPIFSIVMIIGNTGITLLFEKWFSYFLGDVYEGSFKLGFQYEKIKHGLVKFVIYLGFWTLNFSDPGDLVEDDIVDPIELRITREVKVANPYTLLIDHINENFSSVEAINNFKDIVAEYYYPLKQFYKDKFSDNSWLQIELTKPCFAPQSEPPVPEDVLGTEQHIGCFFVMGSCDKFVSKHEKNLIVCLLLDPETRQFTKAFTDPKPDISIKNKMN